MPNTIDIYDTYAMMGIVEEIVPKASFFKDRYFPTDEDTDIFAHDKVLVEYQHGDKAMACFVSDRVGDIPVDRLGSEIHEYEPASIAPSRVLSLDDLAKRGFGEALIVGTSKAERAARLQEKDLKDLDNRISRREEFMAVQTMVTNACEMQEYIDANTKGEKKYILFYNGTSDHIYIPAISWNKEGANIKGDIEAMCETLASRGLQAADLVLGKNVSPVFQNNETIMKLIEKNSGFNFGEINAQLKDTGTACLGVFNFDGFVLTVFKSFEQYQDENGKSQYYFPADGAMVTFPECGHLMYAQVGQIEAGDTEHTFHAGKRVPKLVIDYNADTRKVRLKSRPLAAPKQYCPYMFATVLEAE